MSDRRVRRVLATGSVGDLPVEILRVIWEDVHRAGQRARRALRRYIMKLKVVAAFLDERSMLTLPDPHLTAVAPHWRPFLRSQYH